MKIHTKAFRVKPHSKVELAEWPTLTKPLCQSRADSRARLAEHVERLSKLQRLLYASDRFALLLVIQGMDTAGKDGAIRHVMSGVNPQGCQISSFKQPSVEELGHDFLWRAVCRLPARGQLGIFNRSYYEEVLVVRVHPEVLRSERLPDELDNGEEVWDGRYRSIVDMEGHLHRNGTRVVKIFLHLSQEEQRSRLFERIDDPHRNWKFSPGDIQERTHWKEYMKCYEACFHATSTHDAPWHVVPADNKDNAQLIVSHILVEAMESMKLEYPTTTAERRLELKSIRTMLSTHKRTRK